MKPECSRVMDALGGPLPADLEAHVATCEDCRALLGGFDVVAGAPVASAAPAPAPAAPAPKLEAARRMALEELAAHPKPTPWWRELLVLLAVYVAVFVGGLFLLRRDGLVGNQASPMTIAVVALLTLLLVGGGALVAVAPRWRRLPWGLVALGAVGVAAAQLLGGSGQQSQWRPVGAGLMGCMGSELVLSVLPVAAALVLLCRSAFQPARALAAGLSAAGVSLLVVHIHCSDGTLLHLLVAHVLPWLLLAGVVVLVRSRLPTRSYAP